MAGTRTPAKKKCCLVKAKGDPKKAKQKKGTNSGEDREQQLFPVGSPEQGSQQNVHTNLRFGQDSCIVMVHLRAHQERRGAQKNVTFLASSERKKHQPQLRHLEKKLHLDGTTPSCPVQFYPRPPLLALVHRVGGAAAEGCGSLPAGNAGRWGPFTRMHPNPAADQGFPILMRWSRYARWSLHCICPLSSISPELCNSKRNHKRKSVGRIRTPNHVCRGGHPPNKPEIQPGPLSKKLSRWSRGAKRTHQSVSRGLANGAESTSDSALRFNSTRRFLNRAVGNDHFCDTTERASQRLFSSYKGDSQKYHRSGWINPFPQPCS